MEELIDKIKSDAEGMGLDEDRVNVIVAMATTAYMTGACNALESNMDGKDYEHIEEMKKVMEKQKT